MIVWLSEAWGIKTRFASHYSLLGTTSVIDGLQFPN